MYKDGMNAKHLIEIYGSAIKAAEAMNVGRQTIYDWLNRGMPGAWQEKAELLTDGKFKPSKRAIDEVMHSKPNHRGGKEKHHVPR